MRVLEVKELGVGVAHVDGVQAMADVARDVDAHPTLLLVEHAPVITLTRSAGATHLLQSVDAIRARGIDVTVAARGGDVTFHGPGQLVGYPIVRLPRVRLSSGAESIDLEGYARALERALVDACRALGVESAHAEPGLTGVWVGPSGAHAEKLVSIGVGVSPRGVTRHGFALNVDIALEHYTASLVPCGLVGRRMTSLARLLDDKVPPADVIKRVVATHVARALGFDDVCDGAHKTASPILDSDLSSSLARPRDGARVPESALWSALGSFVDGATHG
jgi:lipoyl(octanoyl) transferase